MSTATVAVPAPTRSREVSFEQHALSCQQSIEMLWHHIEETGMTTREMFELMQQPQIKSLTCGALQETDRDKKRPLAALSVGQDKEGVYDKTLLLVGLIMVTQYHFPVVFMPNGKNSKGAFENRLIVLSDPPDNIRK